MPDAGSLVVGIFFLLVTTGVTFILWIVRECGRLSMETARLRLEAAEIRREAAMMNLEASKLEAKDA